MSSSSRTGSRVAGAGAVPEPDALADVVEADADPVLDAVADSTDADAGLIAKLDAAELRIGLCEDANLAKLLDPALPNLLNFLTSTPPVRAKLMAILSVVFAPLFLFVFQYMPVTHLSKCVRDGATRRPRAPTRPLACCTTSRRRRAGSGCRRATARSATPRACT